MTKNTHRSEPRLRRRRAAQPLGGVAAAGVGRGRRDRPRAARGDGRRLRPHRRRRDLVADDPEPGGRDPLPRAGAVSTIVPRVPVPTLLLRARSRRYISPHHAFPFQRGEPCARVFLFQPPLLLQSPPHPVVRYFGVLARIQASLVSHWPLAASQLDNTREPRSNAAVAHTRGNRGIYWTTSVNR